jgi:hypothetical protein
VEGPCEHGDEPSGSLKILGISWVAAQLAASHVGLRSVSKYRNRMGNCGLDLYGKLHGLFAVSCEHGHKITGSIKARKVLNIRANISLSRITVTNAVI